MCQSCQYKKRTMNKNLCQLCPNIMPTIIVTVGQRWANIILKIFWRWANVAPTCWAIVGTLCTYNVGPTLKANVGPTKWTTLAQRWANVCVLSGELRRLMSTELIKVHLVFTCAIFRNLPVALDRCSKIMFRELHFVNSLLSANFLIGKQQNDTNIRWQK